MIRRSKQIGSLYRAFSKINLAKSSTFVSKYYNVEKSEVMELIGRMDTDYRENRSGFIEVKECKLCNKRNRSNPDNVYKLHVRDDGSFHCFRCAESGSWFDLKRKFANKVECSTVDSSFSLSPEKESQGTLNPPKTSKNKAASVPKQNVLPDQQQFSNYSKTLFPDDLVSVPNENQLSVKQYLNATRGLTDEILRKYHVGMAMQQFMSEHSEWKEQICMTFPWMMSAQDLQTKGVEVKSSGSDTKMIPHVNVEGTEFLITRMKYRALETKGLQRMLPVGGMWGFFGWHLVKPTDKAVIVTEGEYDAMAVAQALSALPAKDPLRAVPVISLPNGCNSLAVELVAMLEQFQKIYLWMDHDKSGMEASEKFSKKLGMARCVIVKPLQMMLSAANVPAPKDANDALRMNVPDLIPTMLRSAKVMAHEKIQTFADLREKVFQSIRRTDMREGSQTPSIPKLSKFCKGFRKGELVVFTGPTGSGKTTLLSQLSLDFVAEGAATMWGSFEIKNQRLVHKMLQQYYKFGSLARLSDDKLEQVANDFQALPLSFMDFHGSTNIDHIMEAMDYAVYKDDVQHVIIDNLQFMMPRSSSKSSFEKFEFQDYVIERFRKFATEKNVNIILVIHPRKEDDSLPLSMSSIFGSAKATQEADLVLILQKYNEQISLDVKKNRYDGSLGKVHLDYNLSNHCFFEIDPPPKKEKEFR